ncbi:polysaccharide biosynthesis protein [Planctomycetes bacterium K23_9]|uniref:UDP-N-acetyl-alpha-D-glucosamine C6 dehydratase n=1 Tax=Stieleria marina TaxID=1930275 RepID=A0A517NSK6_9BACT|nr:UDP-N-acetyl-alpha-D-glucosamine C6 dehydratase [Planctomycetes bacterium K23_9]
MDTNEPITSRKAAVARLMDPLLHPSSRVGVLLILHAVLFYAIYAISYSARYDFSLPPHAKRLMLATAPFVLLIKIAAFYLSSHFHGWWRYVTFADIKSLIRAAFIAMVVIGFADYFFSYHYYKIPRAVIVFDTLLTIILLGGLRCLWRFADEHFGIQFKRVATEPALLIGTDHRAGILASQINSNREMPFRIRALVSTQPSPRRRVYAGIPVTGSIDQISAVGARYNAKHVFIPCDSLGGTQIRDLIANCNRAGLTVRVLPRFEDALAGSSDIPLREVDIDDLLKRDPVKLDTKRIDSLVKGKRVMVTGAGGSIGSEICRQLMEFEPAEIILLGRGENRIYTIHRDLGTAADEHGVKLKRVIANITEENSMRRAFETHRPEIVFHAAAHKHVPLMELHIREALLNNVVGTNVVAKLADEFRCSNFVMVSTDKAVNPTSIMGATKNIAERVVHAMSVNSKTHFCVVRFGNVLGSAGSVVPLFQKQIRAGGPITVTDARMTRYFMSIPEAAQLVLQAGSMAKGGEIFVLDMGEPVEIMQLAEDLVQLSGLKPGTIEIKETGIREGEKLYEELYFDDEATLETEHRKVKAAYHRLHEGTPDDRLIFEVVENLEADEATLRGLISRLVPEYHEHTEPTSQKSELVSVNGSR